MCEDKPGMQNQCVGLAEALGLEPEIRLIAPRAPWRWLPPQAWPAPLAAVPELQPPWPDLLIATGRATVAPAAEIRRQAAGRTVAVQIQNPTTDLAAFDLVVVPAHDRIAGPNVLSTRGALHRVSPAMLAAAAERWAGAWATLPRPLIAVLLGGSNGRHRLTPALAGEVGRRLAAMAAATGGAVAATPSRRTGEANLAAFRQGLGTAPAYVWDGRGDNPYFGLLALADAIVVTADSVSMTSEACATGKPVHVIELPGGSAKFQRFHAALCEAGTTRPFDGSWTVWHYDPLDDTSRAAAAVENLMERRRFDFHPPAP